MKAFGYIRVSTEEQTKGFSLESQKNFIKEYCNKNNIQLVKIFEDHTSGARIDREELKSMLNELNNVDAVIVWKIDRLSRSVKDTIKLMELFEEKSKELISITEPFLSVRGNSQSKLMLHIFSSFAQYERDLIKERTVIGKIQKAKRGLIPTGKAPYGYIYKDNKLFINKEEAKIVKLIFEKYIETKSLARVTEYLNEKGYKNNGKKWTRGRINTILKNPLYKGEYIYNKRTYINGKLHIKPKNEWVIVEKKELAIIDKETFSKVEDILKINSKPAKKSNRQGTGNSLFGGLIKCGICGKSYIVKNRIATKNTKLVYYCTSAKERIPCGNIFIYEPFLEEGIVEIVEYLSNLSKENIYLHLIEETKDSSLDKKLELLNKEEKEIENLIKKFTSEFEYFILEGIKVPSSLKEKLIEYEKKLEQIKQEKISILQEIEKQEKINIDWQEFLDMLNDIKVLLNVADRKDKKLLYTSIFDKIEVYPDKVLAYIKGKKFEIKYKPRILDLTDEDKKLLQEINTVRSKIILLASETNDRNKIAKELNVDLYQVDYCIRLWKKGQISTLRKNTTTTFARSKVFKIVKEYVEKNKIDINKYSANKITEMLNKDLGLNLKPFTVKESLYKLGKKKDKKF